MKDKEKKEGKDKSKPKAKKADDKVKASKKKEPVPVKITPLKKGSPKKKTPKKGIWLYMTVITIIIIITRIFIQDNLSVLIKRTVIKINEYVHAQAMIWRLKLP